MKKSLLLSLILLLAAVINSYAQDDAVTKIGVGVDIGVPAGSARYNSGGATTSYALTTGFTAKLEVPLTTPLSLTLTTGLTGYVTQGGYSAGYDSNYGSYSSGAVALFVPLEAGAKVYAADKLFVEGDLGLSFNINSASSDFTNKKAALIYAPMVGYTIPFGASRVSLDLALRYESRMETGNSYNQVALRALFNFNL
jgi:hypothetical protein